MTLELFSATGALVGGLVAFMINEQLLAGLFAALMIWVAISMARRKDPPGAGARSRAGPGRGGRAGGRGRARTPDRDLGDAAPDPAAGRLVGRRDLGARLPGAPDPARHGRARRSPASTPRCWASAAASSRSRS